MPKQLLSKKQGKNTSSHVATNTSMFSVSHNVKDTVAHYCVVFNKLMKIYAL